MMFEWFKHWTLPYYFFHESSWQVCPHCLVYFVKFVHTTWWSLSALLGEVCPTSWWSLTALHYQVCLHYFVKFVHSARSSMNAFKVMWRNPRLSWKIGVFFCVTSTSRIEPTLSGMRTPQNFKRSITPY